MPNDAKAAVLQVGDVILIPARIVSVTITDEEAATKKTITELQMGAETAEKNGNMKLGSELVKEARRLAKSPFYSSVVIVTEYGDGSSADTKIEFSLNSKQLYRVDTDIGREQRRRMEMFKGIGPFAAPKSTTASVPK